jgi:NADPH:quinone reductase-like Zn-dependent oxidoreductase
VIATAGRADKLALARRLGAAHALDYREGDLAAAVVDASEQCGVDVVLDVIGARHAQTHLRCLAPRARWLVLGLLGGNQASVDLGIVLRRRLQMIGLIMRTRSDAEKSAVVQRFTERSLPAFAQGGLEPIVDRVYPLSEVRAAHERMEGNDNLGKIVLELRA